MRRLPPLLVIAMVALTSAAVGTASAAGAGGNDDSRAAARVLDRLPLVAGSELGESRDRRRSFTVEGSAVSVLAFFRAQLPALGWTERTAAQSSDQTSGIEGGRDEPEDVATTAAPGGTNTEPELAGDPALVGRTRVVFTNPDARLKVVIRPVDDASGVDQPDVAEYRLVVTPR